MSEPSRTAGVFQRLWARPADGAAEPDPADYGTCIGLEFTLDELPAAPPAPPGRTLPGWVRRLAGRGPGAA